METDLGALIASLEKKLEDTRELIDGYDETWITQPIARYRGLRKASILLLRS